MGIKFTMGAVCAFSLAVLASTENASREYPRRTMTRINISLQYFIFVIICLLTNVSYAEARCIQFPVSEGPEKVCVTDFFPDSPVFAIPGEAVALPVPVTFTNSTSRDMTFRIEAVGVVVPPGEGLIVSVTLAPGTQQTFTESLPLVADASTPLRTELPFILGWSAFGSQDGNDDYSSTVEEEIQFFVLGLDSDGDGLTDKEEIFGYDADGDGVIDIDLPAMGADPNHKDIFLEIDWEVGSEIFKSSIDQVKNAFALAPIDAGGVTNPDGRPGINLWIDTGGFTDENGILVGDNFGGGNEIPSAVLGFDEEFYNAKAVNFDARRAPIFHYAIIDADIGGAQGELGGNDIRLGQADEKYQAYTIMHELGHNLYLSHGGDPDENGKRNCEPNYVSTMNYRYNWIIGFNVDPILDFSPARLSDGNRAMAPLRNLEEANLDETQALDPFNSQHLISYVGPPEICTAICSGGPRNGDRCTDDVECVNEDDPSVSGICMGINRNQSSCTTDAQCSGGRCGGHNLYSALANRPIDFNNDRVLEGNVSQNIDGGFLAGPCGNESFAAEIGSLTGWDDWANIRLRFFQFGDFADAAKNEITEELTKDVLEDYMEKISTTHLKITKLGPAEPIEVGAAVQLDYEIKVENLGPQLANFVSVRDELPSGFEMGSVDSQCVSESPDVVQCDIGSLLVGETASIELSVSGSGQCSAGVPQAVVNTVMVMNGSEFAGENPVPEDAMDIWKTEVVDTVPPELSLTIAQNSLSPPNHELVTINTTITVSDACDTNPVVRLVSITSNEPDNGTGDGDTVNDIQGAMFGTDDREFQLRSERSGHGSGRVYTVTYEVTDTSGNVSLQTATVSVPK